MNYTEHYTVSAPGARQASTYSYTCQMAAERYARDFKVADGEVITVTPTAGGVSRHYRVADGSVTEVTSSQTHR